MTTSHISRQRLLLARQALQTSEATQGVRSYEHQQYVDGLQPGIYEVGTQLSNLVGAWQTLWKDHWWAAVMGVKNLGWEALQTVGIDLRRTAVLVYDNDQAAEVLATAVEGFQLLLVGDVQVKSAHQKVLAARARQLERFVLTTHRWPMISSVFPNYSDRQTVRLSHHLQGREA